MFETKKRISFFDCDPAGIFFYGRVYELCHSAYEQMIDSFELEEDYWTNDDYVVPIIQSEAKYRKPITYGQVITVILSVTQIKESSFELKYECKNENGDLCVEVKTVHVVIDKINWEKRPMNKSIQKGLMQNIAV